MLAKMLFTSFFVQFSFRKGKICFDRTNGGFARDLQTKRLSNNCCYPWLDKMVISFDQLTVILKISSRFQ